MSTIALAVIRPLAVAPGERRGAILRGAGQRGEREHQAGEGRSAFWRWQSSAWREVERAYDAVHQSVCRRQLLYSPAYPENHSIWRNRVILHEVLCKAIDCATCVAACWHRLTLARDGTHVNCLRGICP